MQAAGTYPATLIPSLEKAWKESIEADVEKARAMPGVSRITVEAKAGRVRETLMDEFVEPLEPDLGRSPAAPEASATSNTPSSDPSRRSWCAVLRPATCSS